MKKRGSLFGSVSSLLLVATFALPVQADPETNAQSIEESSWRVGAKRVIAWLVDDQPEMNPTITASTESNVDRKPNELVVEPPLPSIQPSHGRQWDHELVDQLSPVQADNKPPLQTILPLLALPNQPQQQTPDIDEKLLVDDCDPALSTSLVDCEPDKSVLPETTLPDVAHTGPVITKQTPTVQPAAQPVVPVPVAPSSVLVFAGLLLLARRATK